MQDDQGMKKIGDLFSLRKQQKTPAYAWQDLALRVISELNVPNFKKSAVFKSCKQKPRFYVEKCMNDAKELCQTGEKWKYFFKLIAGGRNKKTNGHNSKFIIKYPTPKGDS